jgi:hypothetical protein
VRGPLTKLAVTAAATAAAVAARRAAELGWKVATGDEPPRAGPVGNDRELRDLMAWTGVVVLSVLVARKLAVSKAERLLTPVDDEG